MSNALETSSRAELPAPPETEEALRNRRVLLEVLDGRSYTDIALRYGLHIEGVRRAVANAFDDVKAADYHKDVRATVVARIVSQITKIEEWMEHLSPKYKRFHQQLDQFGEEHELWMEENDHLAFIKFQGELRAQWAMLRQILGAELPEEKNAGKEQLQKKMMDAITMSLKVAKQAMDQSEDRVERTVIDVDPIEVLSREDKDDDRS